MFRTYYIANALSVIHLPFPYAVISQTVSQEEVEGLSTITTRCRPITPPLGQVIIAVSAEATTPSIRPHSVKLDAVGFNVVVESGVRSVTPTTALFRSQSETNWNVNS